MSDDVRELIARYATGNLTDREQHRLLEAALEDQDLFDELMGEHALRQLIDQPGVKARLIASLTPPPKKTVWSWPWLTAAAGAAVAVLAIALWLRPTAPRQVAEVRAPAPVPSPQVEPSTSSVVPSAASSAPKKIPPPKIPPETPLQAARNLKKEQEPTSVAQLSEPPAQKDVQNTVEPAAATPLPQPQQFRAPAAAMFAAKAPPARFAFDYEVTADGRLRLTPASNGFFSVASTGGASPPVLSENQAARAGATSEFGLAPDATLVRVIFSAQPLAPEPLPAGFGGALDPPSGTKIDPNPTPNSRLTAVIPLRPR